MSRDGFNFTEVLLSVLFLPVAQSLLVFAWGPYDELLIALGKRFFLLLPIVSVIIAYWMTIACLLSVIIRHRRREFVSAILITWFDLGRAILNFWGGFFKFFYYFIVTFFGLIRIILVGIWVLIYDILLIPFRVLVDVGNNVLNPGVPWLAVVLTIVWCVLEATIFTFVTSPLVVDTLGNVTGEKLSEALIRIPLFIFMLFVVLGSYSVLTSFTEALESKKIGSIIKIGAVETVAAFVEVIFLYREFVDSLVPWFAQYSKDGFELGPFWTIFIALITWVGIRGLSWFLFASSGTPMIMAIIQGGGLKGKRPEYKPKTTETFKLTVSVIDQFKSDMNWVQRKTDELVGVFVLPPLQIIAATINFCTLLITSRHLFELPLRSITDVKDAKSLIQKVSDIRKEESKS